MAWNSVDAPVRTPRRFGARAFAVAASFWLLSTVGLSAQAPRPTGVVVVPMGNAPVGLVQGVSRTFGTRWSIPVDVRSPVPVDPTLIDPKRRQVVAERAMLWLESRFAQQASGRVIIGVMAEDLYSSERSWAFAFSIRKRRPGAPGVAVMSTARMSEAFYGRPDDAALLADRFGKMLAKNLGALFFGLPLNKHPSSVMYRNVLSFEDLDAMTEGFDGRPLEH